MVQGCSKNWGCGLQKCKFAKQRCGDGREDRAFSRGDFILRGDSQIGSE